MIYISLHLGSEKRSFLFFFFLMEVTSRLMSAGLHSGLFLLPVGLLAERELDVLSLSLHHVAW